MAIRHGNCNFRNLEFNTVCGCQEFMPEEEDGVSTGLLSSGGRARKTCLCGHFVNFHSKHAEDSREPKKQQQYGDSFRSARLRSGATSPTSIVALTNGRPTPMTTQPQDSSDRYNLSKTFEDPPRYQSNHQTRVLPGSFGGDTGLGIGLRAARDAGGSNGAQSGDSSAVTEVAPHLNFAHSRNNSRAGQVLAEMRREQRGGSLLQSTRSPPKSIHQVSVQHTGSSKGPADDATVASTVADSQIITGQDRYLEFDRRVNGALHIVHGLSQAFLPLNLQERMRLGAPTDTRDTSPYIAFDEREHLNDELQRQTLAIEAQLISLAKTVAGRLNPGLAINDEPRNRIEELPQSVPTLTQLQDSHRPLETTPLPVVSPIDNVVPAPMRPEPVLNPSTEIAVIEEEEEGEGEEEETVAVSASGPVPLLPGVTESFVNRRLHDISEKVDLQEEMCNDVIKFKNDTEEEITEMGANVFTLEERLNNMENQFQRYIEDREQSFRNSKRARDEDEEGSSMEKKKRKKRRRERDATTVELRTPSSVGPAEKNYVSKKVARGSEVNQLIDGTFKQTLTTTTSFTRTHSTSTSFTSTSSCSTSTKFNQTALIKSLSSQIGVLQQRLQQVEAVSAPSTERPWVVQVIVLPQCTWTTWRPTKEGDLLEQQRGPRVIPPSGRAWKRLNSRGLIKCLEITGGEYRDIERAIRKAFGAVLNALFEASEISTQQQSPYDWSPLRKVPDQLTLRALSTEEMSRQFWKIDFLRGTCAEDICLRTAQSPRSPNVPPSDTQTRNGQAVRCSPQKIQINRPTHRLYITNCWTAGMGASWDTAGDNTQLSSVNSKRRAGSAVSTQVSSVGTSGLRRKSKLDVRSSTSPKIGDHNYRSVWSEIRNLPPASVYVQDSKHEISSVKPRLVEDEAFWYYDALLDGPRDDSSSSGEASGSEAAQSSGKEDGQDQKLLRSTQRSFSSSSSRRKDTHRSQRVATHPTIYETGMSMSLTQQPPLLVSQTSLSGRPAPSLSRNSSRNLGDGDPASASLGTFSHDSDSTPKARSFVNTQNSSFQNTICPPTQPAYTTKGTVPTVPPTTRVLRSSRRVQESQLKKEPKDTSGEKTPTNSMVGDRIPSQTPLLNRESSKGSTVEQWEDAPARLSRASTVEDHPPASLLINPHNSEEMNAELKLKYGHDHASFSKYIEPLAPLSASLPLPEKRRGRSKE
ncbi:hypothetical protein TWF102_004952 [Orbilia oligospora]|uniref:Uncharacterized protein n=2 Tax=Orbilia oligospora TaxID=2813651 RepID=A0A7C8J7X9_ORBOL|nr:hypothetical protein TWF103_000953 [Orbilia oligospora]KAF3101141.1 hypothetical protein TWF102_004952 [Orbilia oligospora]